MHRRLERLYTRFEQNPNDEDNIDIELIKENINEILQIRLNGSIIRSRQNWHEHGEKSSKFFLNFENRNFNNKTVKCLKLDDGKIITQSSLVGNWTPRAPPGQSNETYFFRLIIMSRKQILMLTG